MEKVEHEEMHYWRTPKGVRRAYLDARFGQVHYRIARPSSTDRRPLVCFHLSPNSGRVYNLFLADMGKDRVAVAPDTPGFGESDPPSKAPEIDDYAACMGDVIDALGFDEVDVMGYHTGSKTALILAKQRPAQVKRIVLISAPVYTESELAEQRKAMGNPEADKTSADGSHLATRWNSVRQWADTESPMILCHREVVESLRGGETAWWGHRAAFAKKHSDLLPEINQPILLLCPKDDLWTPTQRARDLLVNGQFLEMPTYAHGMLDIHTQKIASVVRDFLDAPLGPSKKTKPLMAPIAEPAPVRTIKRNFMDGTSGQIHYRIAQPDVPSKVPLICFHMSPNSGRIFESIIVSMGNDRAVVAPDTPGFGESDAPESPPEISDYADAMSQVIEKLKFKEVDVMGYHTGSETCIELAIQRPDLVRRIVQISCPVFTDEEFEEFRHIYEKRKMDETGQHLVDKWQQMVPFYGPDVPHNVFIRNFAEGLRGGPVSHWGHRAAFNYDLRKELPKVNKPILVINPNDDLVEQTPRGIPLMKQGRLVDIPDIGHGFIDQITHVFANYLREFLDA